MAKDLLMTPEEFLKSGLHIGTRYKTAGMRKYIYKIKKDGLKVLAIETISDKIKLAAKIIAQYEPDKIAVVGRRIFASTPIKKFCEIHGCKPFVNRFIPGNFTNPTMKRFFEPELLIVTEPNLDNQAIIEAKENNIPVIAFCSTNNFTENIDFVIPANNKGRKSLATLFWLLAREVMLAKEVIKTRQEFKQTADDFEYKGKEVKTMMDRRNGGKGKGRGRKPFGSRGPGQGGFGRDRPQGQGGFGGYGRSSTGGGYGRSSGSGQGYGKRY